MEPPTRAQLEIGANSISYRACQLAQVVELIGRRAANAGEDPRFKKTIDNALIESALVNARVLALFFTESKDTGASKHSSTRSSDLRASMYSPTWCNDVLDVAKKSKKLISQFLSHTVTGAEDGETHPGEWPIVELAHVFVGAFAGFHAELDPWSDAYDIAWFHPDPKETYKNLLLSTPTKTPPPMSDNKSVAALTEALQAHLQSRS